MKLIPWQPLAINGVRNLIGAGVIGIWLLITGPEESLKGVVRFLPWPYVQKPHLPRKSRCGFCFLKLLTLRGCSPFSLIPFPAYFCTRNWVFPAHMPLK